MECPKCGRTFPSLTKLERHQRRKTPCSAIIDSKLESVFRCKSCNRILASRVGLTRHHRTCVVYQNAINKKISNFNYHDMQNFTFDIIKSPTNFIEDKIIIERLMTCETLGPLSCYLMKFIHDNEKFPECRNIFIGSFGEHKNKIFTYQDGKWVETGLSQIGMVIYGEMFAVMLDRIGISVLNERIDRGIDKWEFDKFNTEMRRALVGPIKQFKLSKNNPTDLPIIGSDTLEKQVNVLLDD